MAKTIFLEEQSTMKPTFSMLSRAEYFWAFLKRLCRLARKLERTIFSATAANSYSGAILAILLEISGPNTDGPDVVQN